MKHGNRVPRIWRNREAISRARGQQRRVPLPISLITLSWPNIPLSGSDTTLWVPLGGQYRTVFDAEGHLSLALYASISSLSSVRSPILPPSLVIKRLHQSTSTTYFHLDQRKPCILSKSIPPLVFLSSNEDHGKLTFILSVLFLDCLAESKIKN